MGGKRRSAASPRTARTPLENVVRRVLGASDQSTGDVLQENGGSSSDYSPEPACKVALIGKPRFRSGPGGGEPRAEKIFRTPDAELRQVGVRRQARFVPKRAKEVPGTEG